MTLALEDPIAARGCGGRGCDDCPFAATGSLHRACAYERGLSRMSDLAWLLPAVDAEVAQRWSDHVDSLLLDRDTPVPDGPRRLTAEERAASRTVLEVVLAALAKSPPDLEAVRAVFPGVDQAPMGAEAWVFDTAVTAHGLAALFRVADEHDFEVRFGY